MLIVSSEEAQFASAPQYVMMPQVGVPGMSQILFASDILETESGLRLLLTSQGFAYDYKGRRIETSRIPAGSRLIGNEFTGGKHLAQTQECLSGPGGLPGAPVRLFR